MTNPSELRDISMSVSCDANSDVALTIWLDIIEGESLRVVLTPPRAASLLRDLTNQTTYALLAAAESIARGDCAACGNTRMVKVPNSAGREFSEHCPACAIDLNGGYPARPQIGGGVG